MSAPPRGCWDSVGRWGIELHGCHLLWLSCPQGLGFVPPSAGDVGVPVLREPQEPGAAPVLCWEWGPLGRAPTESTAGLREEDAPSADPDSPVTVPGDAAAGTQQPRGSPVLGGTLQGEWHGWGHRAWLARACSAKCPRPSGGPDPGQQGGAPKKPWR